MYVRLIKHWNGFKPGRIFCDAPDGMAQVLIARGMAVADGPESPAEDVCPETPPVAERIAKPSPKRSRKPAAAR